MDVDEHNWEENSLKIHQFRSDFWLWYCEWLKFVGMFGKSVESLLNLDCWIEFCSIRVNVENVLGFVVDLFFNILDDFLEIWLLFEIFRQFEHLVCNFYRGWKIIWWHKCWCSKLGSFEVLFEEGGFCNFLGKKFWLKWECHVVNLVTLVFYNFVEVDMILALVVCEDLFDCERTSEDVNRVGLKFFLGHEGSSEIR